LEANEARDAVDAVAVPSSGSEVIEWAWTTCFGALAAEGSFEVEDRAARQLASCFE
jgi:hypothetical protein